MTSFVIWFWSTIEWSPRRYRLSGLLQGKSLNSRLNRAHFLYRHRNESLALLGLTLRPSRAPSIEF